MMNKQKRRSSTAALLGVAALLTILVGCGRSVGKIELTSYGEDRTPTRHTTTFKECFHYTEPGGDRHFLGQARSSLGEATNEEIVQLLHVHLFWRPWPGKTHDNPSMIDAVLHYVVVTPTGAAVYSGAGYAYPKKQRFGDDVVLSIESGRLLLKTLVGDAPDLLGPSRISGSIKAAADQARALDLRREIDLCIGR